MRRPRERRADVQRAAATFRWTGSWYTVFVTADRFGGAAVDAPFKARLRRHLERFRMAGYDLEVDGPRYVALDVTLHICVQPDYLPQRGAARGADRSSAAACCPTVGSRSSTPTTSRSASRCT